MFARVFNSISEPFTVSDARSAEAEKMNTFFATTMPNSVLSSDPNLPLSSLTADSDGGSTLEDPYANTGLSQAVLNARQASCQGSGVDPFQHLTSLVDSQDPRSFGRCGWVYNTQNPQKGSGAFGVQAGPWKTSAKGLWMWDLKQAKKKVHMNLCQGVKDCGDINVAPYAGRCGFCTSSGMGIPVNRDGSIAYPEDANSNCAKANIILAGAACPVPVPGVVTPGSSPCDPLGNGSLSRDCIIQKARQAGCDDKGTLIQSLKSASDLNYIDTLSATQAYGVYKQRATVGLDELALKTGKTTVANALNEFRRVADQAASLANTGLQASARDLCYKAGSLEAYDFCSEITDQTRSPYSLNCLQRLFLTYGGQKSGTMYPSNTNISREWNTQTTWGDVKAKIQALLDGTNSKNRGVQEDSMAAFYGMNLENRRNPLLPSITGVEIFWFNHQWDVSKPTMFLGRRIRPTIPELNQRLDLQGTQGNTNKYEMVSMVYMTNIFTNTSKSIRIRATGDDGFAMTLNKPLLNIQNNRVVTNANELTALGYFPPTTYANNTCWQLNGGGQNILQGYWFNGCCGFVYKVEFQDNCNGNSPTSWSTFPSAMCNLTQEPFAPMLNFMVIQNPSSYGCDFSFCDRRMGSYKMKWAASKGTPSWSYAPKTSDPVNYPLGKSLVTLGVGVSIKSVFTMKMYSFTTMTMCVTFLDVPNNSMNISYPLNFFGSQALQTQICLTGTGDYKTGELYLSDSLNGTVKGGLIIKTGVPYLITLRMLRGSDTDINSVYGAQLGCAPLSDLQASGGALKETPAMTFSNPKAFDDPNSPGSRSVIISGDSTMNLYWLNFFDYKMDSKTVQREANQDWLFSWY